MGLRWVVQATAMSRGKAHIWPVLRSEHDGQRWDEYRTWTSNPDERFPCGKEEIQRSVTLCQAWCDARNENLTEEEEQKEKTRELLREIAAGHPAEMEIH